MIQTDQICEPGRCWEISKHKGHVRGRGRKESVEAQLDSWELRTGAVRNRFLGFEALFLPFSHHVPSSCPRMPGLTQGRNFIPFPSGLVYTAEFYSALLSWKGYTGSSYRKALEHVEGHHM